MFRFMNRYRIGRVREKAAVGEEFVLDSMGREIGWRGRGGEGDINYGEAPVDLEIGMVACLEDLRPTLGKVHRSDDRWATEVLYQRVPADDVFDSLA